MTTREPILGDAFGQALLAHLDTGQAGMHVLERTDGSVDTMPASIYFGDVDAWTVAERSALEWVTGRVLDVGAGAGRISLNLQAQGMEVTALDVSAGAIEVCSRRGVHRTYHGSLFDLAAASSERFDSFVFFGNNLGLLGSPAAAVEMLETIRVLASPGARVIGTMLDPYNTTDPDHLAYHAANRAAGRLAGEVTIRIRYRQLTTGWFDLLWVSPDELRQIVEPAGFAITRTWDDGPFYSVVLEAA